MRRPLCGMSGPRSTAAAMCTRPSSTSTASSNRCRSWRCRAAVPALGPDRRRPAGPGRIRGMAAAPQAPPAGYLAGVLAGVASLIAAPYARNCGAAPGPGSTSERARRRAQPKRPQRHGDPAPALRSRFQLSGSGHDGDQGPRDARPDQDPGDPPASEDVWICVDPQGHIQAIGTDAAGRRQYRYHDLWREQRDQDKHDRVREFGAALPRIREVIGRHLDGRGPDQGPGPRGRDTPDRPRFLPAGRRGVRRGERHLRAGDHPEGTCDAQPGPAGVRIPGQEGQAARAARGGGAASAPSPGWSAKWPIAWARPRRVTWATPPPWPGPLISIRASSSSTRTVTRSLRCLVTWTGRAISAISPPGGAPRARW